MTTCILTSALGKIRIAPYLPERKYCLRRRVSAHIPDTGVGKSLYSSHFGNVTPLYQCNAMQSPMKWEEGHLAPQSTSPFHRPEVAQQLQKINVFIKSWLFISVFTTARQIWGAMCHSAAHKPGHFPICSTTTIGCLRPSPSITVLRKIIFAQPVKTIRLLRKKMV